MFYISWNKPENFLLLCNFSKQRVRVGTKIQVNKGADDGLERVPDQQNSSTIKVEQVLQPADEVIVKMMSYLWLPYTRPHRIEDTTLLILQIIKCCVMVESQEATSWGKEDHDCHILILLLTVLMLPHRWRILCLCWNTSGSFQYEPGSKFKQCLIWFLSTWSMCCQSLGTRWTQS